MTKPKLYTHSGKISATGFKRGAIERQDYGFKYKLMFYENGLFIVKTGEKGGQQTVSTPYKSAISARKHFASIKIKP